MKPTVALVLLLLGLVIASLAGTARAEPSTDDIIELRGR